MSTSVHSYTFVQRPPVAMFCNNCFISQFVSDRNVTNCQICNSEFIEEIDPSSSLYVLSMNRNTSANNSLSDIGRYITELLILNGDITPWNNVLFHPRMFHYIIEYIVNDIRSEIFNDGSEPISNDHISNIKKILIAEKHLEKDKIQCTICLENIEKNEFIGKLKCKHAYHYDCVLKWLKLHGICPICRYKV